MSLAPDAPQPAPLPPTFTDAVAAFARARGVRVVDVLGSVTQVIAQASSPRAARLPAAERELLLGDGSLTEGELAQAESAVANGAYETHVLSAHLETINESLSTDAAARALGITASAVRHRIAKGTLCAFKIGEGHRVPAWQFTPTDAGRGPTVHDVSAPMATVKILPHLAALIAAIPDSATPAEIIGLMTTPQDGLGARGSMTIPEWLATGGDPGVALGLVADLREVW